jgi:hypothetical protein
VRGRRAFPQALCVALGAVSACGGPGSTPLPLPPGDYTPRRVPHELVMPAAQAPRLRDDALARARVWRPPPVPVERANLRDAPPGDFQPTDELVCRFFPRPSEGRTPKFQCVLPGGDVIKVKYGRGNRERLAEVAGTRLALALGFGADDMIVVRRVTCWGCPAYPYPKLPWLDALLADSGRASTFDHPVVERTFPGREIVAGAQEGWSWDELAKVDESRGGGTRAERDALRLFAVFLHHWDSKARNQRLVCLPGGERPDGTCTAPFALIADFGATFGPRRADVAAWGARPVWDDPLTCAVSMRDLPYGGGTFPDLRISEEGRVFLAQLLGRLRTEQVRDLFTAARFGETTGGPVEPWVRAFEDRVQQITDRGPCPER